MGRIGRGSVYPCVGCIIFIYFQHPAFCRRVADNNDLAFGYTAQIINHVHDRRILLERVKMNQEYFLIYHFNHPDHYTLKTVSITWLSLEV